MPLRGYFQHEYIRMFADPLPPKLKLYNTIKNNHFNVLKINHNQLLNFV